MLVRIELRALWSRDYSSPGPVSAISKQHIDTKCTVALLSRYFHFGGRAAHRIWWLWKTAEQLPLEGIFDPPTYHMIRTAVSPLNGDLLYLYAPKRSASHFDRNTLRTVRLSLLNLV